MQGILLRIFREFPSRAQAPDQDLALEVMAHSGMMKEILHSLPRPWPADLPERVTRLFLHGIGVGGKAKGRRAAVIAVRSIVSWPRCPMSRPMRLTAFEGSAASRYRQRDISTQSSGTAAPTPSGQQGGAELAAIPPAE